MQMPEAYASVGAMTHSFVKAVECEPPGVTYGRLLTAMKAIMLNSGGNCNMQGPIGAPIRKIANFSGVQVRLETCCMPFCVDKSLPGSSIVP
jgi:metacaspase-1